MPLSNPPTLEQILDDAFWSEQFFKFCEEIGTLESIQFYNVVEKLGKYQAMKQSSNPLKKLAGTVATAYKTPRVARKYVAEGGEREINIDGRTRTGVMNSPTLNNFLAAQEGVVTMLKMDTLPKFLKSKRFEVANQHAPALSRVATNWSEPNPFYG